MAVGALVGSLMQWPCHASEDESLSAWSSPSSEMSEASPAEVNPAPGTPEVTAPLPAKDTKPVEKDNARTNFGLAPIRWGGYTADTFRLSRGSDQPRSLDHSQRLDLRASSYLWQPWMATVSGGIGLAKGLFSSDDNTGDSDSTSITGFGDLTLFPQSRFPFTAGFSVTDSTSSSEITTDDMRSKRFSLRQSYRPETGNTNFTASYQNSTMTSKLNGDDVVENWQGIYATTIGKHTVGLDAERAESSRSQNTEGLLMDTFNARHSFSSGPNLTVDSNFRHTSTSLRNRTGIDLNSSVSKYLQAGSSVTWRPRESLPLNITGGVSLFKAESDVNGTSASSDVVSANLAATYNPTRNLSLSVNGSVAAASADEAGTNLITTQNASASYSGDALNFGKFSYHWNVSGTVSNQTDSDSDATQALSLGASHGLSRDYLLTQRSSLNLNLNQSATQFWGGDLGQYTNLNHSAALAYSINPSDMMSGSLTLSATDTRSTGSQRTENQFISLQGNGRAQLSTYETATLNAGLQWTRQGGSDGDQTGGAQVPESTSLYTTGSFSYQHARAFGVNNLRYSLVANLNAQQANARLLGDVDATTDPVGYSLDQHFDYRIGRIDMNLTGTISSQDGEQNALLFFRIGRAFGNY